MKKGKNIVEGTTHYHDYASRIKMLCILISVPSFVFPGVDFFYHAEAPASDTDTMKQQGHEPLLSGNYDINVSNFSILNKRLF